MGDFGGRSWRPVKGRAEKLEDWLGERGDWSMGVLLAESEGDNCWGPWWRV